MEYQPPHRGRRGARASLSDTIVAAATPPGQGGIAVVRLSGPQVPRLGAALLGTLPAPRRAANVRFFGADDAVIDAGLALYFPAPRSYTGEPVLELHCHGSPVVVEALIRRALELGCRAAQPGEFTQRAFLNGKIDLAQAEAVADLIGAASESAAQAALRSLAGEFSMRVRALVAALGELRAQVEAGIDFAEEPVGVVSDAALRRRLEELCGRLGALQREAGRGRRLTEGLTVVIAGAPNAGKSTLLNRLAGVEAAIVTAIPGTTRDLLREHVLIDGLPLHLVDTAGLREQADEIETEGIRRARDAMARADRILWVVDAAADPQAAACEVLRAQLPEGVPVTLLLNKIDLRPEAAAEWATGRAQAAAPALALSALSGEGVEDLRAHLKACAGMTGEHSGLLSARTRHLEALRQAADHIVAGQRQLEVDPAPELLAEELRLAQASLGQITGEEGSEELLDRIFASFCIGK